MSSYYSDHISNELHFLGHMANCYASGKAERMPAMREVRQMFARLGLPLPHRGEYYVTNTRGGAMLFLEDYGVTLRIHPTRYHEERLSQLPDHPFVLQPLTRFAGNHFVYELYPGCLQGMPDYHANSFRHSPEISASDPTDDYPDTRYCELLHEILDADGVHKGYEKDITPSAQLTVDIDEINPTNCVHIPAVSEDFPHGLPLVCDGKWVQSPTFVRDKITHPMTLAQHDAQKNYFAPAREAVERAWPQDTVPNAARMTALWNALKDLKQQGLLSASWTNAKDIDRLYYNSETKKSEECVPVSARYATHIREFQQKKQR